MKAQIEKDFEQGLRNQNLKGKVLAGEYARVFFGDGRTMLGSPGGLFFTKQFSLIMHVIALVLGDKSRVFTGLAFLVQLQQSQIRDLDFFANSYFKSCTNSQWLHTNCFTLPVKPLKTLTLIVRHTT